MDAVWLFCWSLLETDIRLEGGIHVYFTTVCMRACVYVGVSGCCWGGQVFSSAPIYSQHGNHPARGQLSLSPFLSLSVYQSRVLWLQVALAADVGKHVEELMTYFMYTFKVDPSGALLCVQQVTYMCHSAMYCRPRMCVVYVEINRF